MYQLTENTSILRADGACIPADAANTDYANYLAWVAEGNTAEPYIEPVQTVVEQLARLDAENALSQRNLRDFIRVTTEALKLGQPVDLTVLPGVAKVYAVEEQAAALRAQLP